MKYIEHKYLSDINEEYAYDNISPVLTRNVLEIYMKRLIKDKVPFSLLFCDIDYFKTINDTNGHQVGDMVLHDVSSTMIELANEFDGVVGRYGGDEYVIIVEGNHDYETIWKYGSSVAQGVRNKELDYLDSSSGMKNITLTMGISRYPLNSNTYDGILETADKALYRGKMKGRNCFIIYQEDLHGNIKAGNNTSYGTLEDAVIYINNTLIDGNHSLEENFKTILEHFYNKYNLIYAGITFDDKLGICVCDSEYTHEPIPLKFYSIFAKNVERVMFINTRRFVNDVNHDFYMLLRNQGIRSYLACKCECNGKCYGVLRFDDRRERIWNSEEKLVILILANAYALVKYESEKGAVKKPNF